MVYGQGLTGRCDYLCDTVIQHSAGGNNRFLPWADFLSGFLSGYELSVGSNDIKKRFDPGFETGVSRMTVQLKRKRWFATHDISEVSNNKGIRSAGKVGYISAEELRMLFNGPGCVQYTLTHAPVHMAFGFSIIDWNEI